MACAPPPTPWNWSRTPLRPHLEKAVAGLGPTFFLHGGQWINYRSLGSLLKLNCSGCFVFPPILYIIYAVDLESLRTAGASLMLTTCKLIPPLSGGPWRMQQFETWAGLWNPASLGIFKTPEERLRLTLPFCLGTFLHLSKIDATSVTVKYSEFTLSTYVHALWVIVDQKLIFTRHINLLYRNRYTECTLLVRAHMNSSSLTHSVTSTLVHTLV